MRAVWTRARSNLRRHIRSVIVLSVLIGLTSAVALASAAGAQRTNTAYSRLRAASNAPDSIVFSGTGVMEVVAPHVDSSLLAQLPQVEAVHTAAFFLGEGVGADGKPLSGAHAYLETSIVGAPTIEEQSAMPWKVLEGRLPDPTRSDEVAIGYMKQPDPQAAVGSTIDLRLLKASVTAEELVGASAPPDSEGTLLGPPISVRVVGRVVVLWGVNELGGGNVDIFVTPSFVQRYQPSAATAEVRMVTLKNGQADALAFEEGLLAIYPDAQIGSQSGLLSSWNSARVRGIHHKHLDEPRPKGR